MKLSRTAIRELTARYRYVLLKCFALAIAGTIAFGATGAMAATNDGGVVIGTGASAGTVQQASITYGGSTTSATGPYSTAMGYSTEASGLISTAMGWNTIASEQASTAMGQDTIASGESSTAMGYSTTASGESSTAMGIGSTASEYGSTAMGLGTTASGDGSTAMGAETTASGDGSTAMGANTTASGVVSTAIGFGSIAGGIGSFAGGGYLDDENYVNGGTASGISSFAFGTGAQTGVITAFTGDGSEENPYVYTYDGGDNAVAMGNTAKAYGDNTIAIGNGAIAGTATLVEEGTGTDPNTYTYSGENAIALGASAQATKDNSVAIGYQAVSDTENMIALGNSDATVKIAGKIKVGSAATITSTTANILDMGGNKLTNVSDGVADSDVATVGQIKTQLGTVLSTKETNLSEQFGYNVANNPKNTTVTDSLVNQVDVLKIAYAEDTNTEVSIANAINLNTKSIQDINQTLVDARAEVEGLIETKEDNLSAQLGYDVTLDPSSDETGSVKKSLTSHDTSLVAGINTAYAEALKRTVTNDLTAGTSTITDGTNSTTVYTTTAIDEKLQAARDEITAVYDNSHKWAEDLLGVNVDADVETQLQAV